MSAELAILNNANRVSGDTKVIFAEDYDEEWMIDISDKFFAGLLKYRWKFDGNLLEEMTQTEATILGNMTYSYENVKFNNGIKLSTPQGQVEYLRSNLPNEDYPGFSFWLNVESIHTDDPAVLAYNFYRELQNDVFLWTSTGFLDTNLQHPTALTFVTCSIVDTTLNVYHNGALWWSTSVPAGTGFKYLDNLANAAQNSTGVFNIGQVEVYQYGPSAAEALFLYNRTSPEEMPPGTIAPVINPDNKYKIVIMRDTKK